MTKEISRRKIHINTLMQSRTLGIIQSALLPESPLQNVPWEKLRSREKIKVKWFVQSVAACC